METDSNKIEVIISLVNGHWRTLGYLPPLKAFSWAILLVIKMHHCNFGTPSLRKIRVHLWRHNEVWKRCPPSHIFYIIFLLLVFATMEKIEILLMNIPTLGVSLFKSIRLFIPSDYLLWFHRTSPRPPRWQCLLPSAHWCLFPFSPGWYQKWVSVPLGLRLFPAVNIKREVSNHTREEDWQLPFPVDGIFNWVYTSLAANGTIIATGMTVTQPH